MSGFQEPTDPNQEPEIYKVNTLRLSDEQLAFKDSAFDAIIEHIDLSAAAKLKEEELKREVEHFIIQMTQEQTLHLNFREQQYIAQDIVNDMIGLGPLEALLSDESITDIMVNSFDSVFVERKGKLIKTDVVFRSNTHVLQVSQRIAGQIGRRVDESSPMVDARLKDGSRVNVIIPPLALEGSSISIRKFSKTTISLEQMERQGNISPEILKFLRLASKCRLNIIISGGTGSGKTTMLNALSQLIDPGERIVTIEDSAELKLQQPHVVRLESRPANTEGKGAVTIRDLVVNSLRMRPDRIVVGECRGPEAFDMLQAMNTGHDGSLSTLHANTAQDSLSRMENLMMMTGMDLPSHVLRQYIADAVDLVVQVSRMRDGMRRVTQVMEVSHFNKDGTIEASDLFKFVVDSGGSADKVLGHYEIATKEPFFMDKLKYFGLDDEMKQILEGAKHA